MTRMPTIDDVAAMAQVARTTVSRVINNGPNVRPEVRQRVRDAIEALGYKVNAQARHLASGSSRQIALIHASDADSEPNSYYHSGLEVGAMRACAEYALTLVNHVLPQNSEAGRGRIIDLARSGTVEGIILTPPYSDDVGLIDAVVALGCPIVTISAGAAARSHAAWVSIDDREAGRTIGRYLAKLGHRRFGYIDGIEGHLSAGTRLEGFLDALTLYDIDRTRVDIMRGNFAFRSGVQIAEKLLSRPDRPTAIVCANDDMAAGALLAAHRLGLDIPGEISITGFDDTPVSEIVWPPLTTIHQPIRKLGASAVKHLAALMAGRSGAAAKKGGFVPFELVIRETTGAV